MNAEPPRETPGTPGHRLWRDPRVVSIGVAVGLMVFDDMPRDRYSTFHDPGGAAVLSILLALACGLLAVTSPYFSKTRRRLIAILVFLIFLYAGGNGMLYVQHARVIDPLVLWVGCLVIGMAYVSATRRWRRLATVFLSVPLAFGLSIGLGWLARHYALETWSRAWPFFVGLAACRVLVPYCFWTMLIPGPGAPAKQGRIMPHAMAPAVRQSQ